ncbi:MAG: D-aminoacyl-tRNA deacylase [Chloroflexota bacterium]
MVQRVRGASVEVGGDAVGSIGRGLVVLLGVGANDDATHGERLAAKIAALRVFDDGSGKMQHAVADAGGSVLVVPQFTLYGDIGRGRRPDFTAAAPPELGRRLYDAFCGVLRGGGGLTVTTGVFGATMRVQIDADGPVTIVVSTDRWSEGEL